MPPSPSSRSTTNAPIRVPSTAPGYPARRPAAPTADRERPEYTRAGGFRGAPCRDATLTAIALDLGPFRLHHALASGGMGVVWRGEHRASGLPVAVKLLRPLPGRRQDRQAEALLAEVRTLARLAHPNVVQVLDFGLVGAHGDPERIPPGSPWMALELVEGGAVVGTPADWDGARRLLVDVLDGLAHAHARGVLHRDVKPDNVLLTAEGHARLTDFGLAAIDTGDRFAWSASGGTIAYVAPEQLAGHETDQGPWTDLYAVGGLAWCLVTGRPPRDTSSPDPFAALVAPRLPWSPRYPVPPGLRSWCEGLLAHRPDDRPRSAAEARHGLLALGPAPAARSAAFPAATLDPASTWDLDAVAVPEPEAPPTRSRPAGAAPVPPDWRRAEPQPPRRLRDVGLAVGAWRSLPTLGREPLQDALWAGLRAVERDRTPRLFAAVGPSGSGRTHVARWFGERAHEAGCLVVQGPVGPAGARLAARLLRVDAAAAPALREAVGRRLQGWDEARVAALLRVLRPDPEAPLPAPDARAVLAELVAATAADRVVVAVLDDVHADPGAMGVARALLACRAPVAVLVTAPDVASLGPLSAQAEVHPLAPLSARAGRWLIEHALPLSSEFAAKLQARTGSHPGLAVDLLRAWMRDGRLVPGTGGYALEGPFPDDLPTSRTELARARVDAALAEAPEDRTTLSLAALLGAPLSFATLRAAAARLGEPVDDARIARWVTAGLVEAHPDGDWQFCDPLVARVLADRAHDGPRLHAACAEALADLPHEALRRGRHLLAAGRPGDAVDLLQRGASLAAHQGREAEALDGVARMKEALDLLGDPADPRYVTVETGRAKFHLARRAFAEAAAAIDRAEAHVATHLAGDPAAFGEVMLVRAEAAVERHAFEDGLRHVDRGLASGAPQSERLRVVRALCLLGLGRFEESLQAVVTGDDATRGLHAYVRGEAYSELGRLDEARSVLSRSFDARLAAGERLNAGGTGITLALVARQQGDHHEALRVAERTVALLDAVALHWVQAAWVQRGLTHLALGADDLARADLERVIREVEEGEHGALCWLGLGVLAARRGDLDGAVEALLHVPAPHPEHPMRRAELRDVEALGDAIVAALPALADRVSQVVGPLTARPIRGPPP